MAAAEADTVAAGTSQALADMAAAEADTVAAGMVAADTSQALADMAAGLAGTAAVPSVRRILAGRASAAHVLRLIQSEAAVSPGVWHVSAGRTSAARALQLIRSEVAVRSVPASRRRGSAARATGSPPRRPTRSGVPRHAWATRVAGCSATAPSPTWRFNRNSGTRDSTAGSLVRPGLGGVAAWPSAGSDRYSGPTPTTTCSITFTGPMPMTTFGRMPTMMSTMASTVLTPIAALTVTAPMPIRTDTMPAGARAAA